LVLNVLRKVKYLDMKITLLVLFSSVYLTFVYGKNPRNCKLAIRRCCDKDSGQNLPLRCFELNNCPGLFFAGPKVCKLNGKSLAESINLCGRQQRNKVINAKVDNGTLTFFQSRAGRLQNECNAKGSNKLTLTGCKLQVVQDANGKFLLNAKPCD